MSDSNLRTNLLRDLKLNLVYSAIFLSFTIISVLFFDRPLVLFSHNHNLDNMLWLDHFTENSPQIICIVASYLILIKSDNLGRWQKIFLLTGVALLLILALYCKSELKCILGRNWSSYWLGVWSPSNSPYGSSYGFHFNLSSHWEGSMPSGHISFVGTLSLMLWYAFPAWRILIFMYLFLLICSLVALNHHFLGDCFAGLVLGSLINMIFILYYNLLLKFSEKKDTLLLY